MRGATERVVVGEELPGVQAPSLADRDAVGFRLSTYGVSMKRMWWGVEVICGHLGNSLQACCEGLAQVQPESVPAVPPVA